MEDNNNQYRRPREQEEQGIHSEQLSEDNQSKHKEFNDEQEFIIEQRREPAQESKSTAYYSYGPYKSIQEDIVKPSDLNSTNLQHYDTSYPAERKPKTDWEYPRAKKKSAFKGTFASLLAGMVIMGSLMFASDKMNMFTGDEGIFAASNVPDQTQNVANNNNNGGVTNTAIDLVRPNNIAEMVKNASPAVIKVEAYVKGSPRGQGGGLLDDPFFRQFFDEETVEPEVREEDQELQPFGMGTGFIFDKSGYILTNQHVIDGADEIRVTVEGYKEPFVAKLLGESFDLDLAALKIEGTKDFPFLNLGKSEELSVGDWVVAIGNPYGFDHTVTVGVLSAKEREISVGNNQNARDYKQLLQTDASINPGNSGGPLLNLNGEVIGINTAISAQAQGIGFAIPISTISTVLDDLKNDIEIPKAPDPYIGVELRDIDKDWLEELNISSTDGAMIYNVSLGTPAYKAGLRTYDVITAIDGVKVKDVKATIEIIKAKKVGDKVAFSIVRDGKKSEVSVTIGDRNAK